eukprot:scaffold2868_cov171-Amphora_coffeaeformis.AAC.16
MSHEIRYYALNSIAFEVASKSLMDEPVPRIDCVEKSREWSRRPDELAESGRPNRIGIALPPQYPQAESKDVLNCCIKKAIRRLLPGRWYPGPLPTC